MDKVSKKTEKMEVDPPKLLGTGRVTFLLHNNILYRKVFV